MAKIDEKELDRIIEKLVKIKELQEEINKLQKESVLYPSYPVYPTYPTQPWQPMPITYDKIVITCETDTIK